MHIVALGVLSVHWLLVIHAIHWQEINPLLVFSFFSCPAGSWQHHREGECLMTSIIGFVSALSVALFLYLKGGGWGHGFICSINMFWFKLLLISIWHHFLCTEYTTKLHICHLAYTTVDSRRKLHTRLQLWRVVNLFIKISTNIFCSLRLFLIKRKM